MSAVEDTTTRTTSSGPGRRRIWHLLAQITPALMMFVVKPGKDSGCLLAPDQDPVTLQKAVAVGAAKNRITLNRATPDGRGNTKLVYQLKSDPSPVVGSSTLSLFEADDAAGINCHQNTFTEKSSLCDGASGYSPLSMTLMPRDLTSITPYTTTLNSKKHLVVCTDMEIGDAVGPYAKDCEELNFQGLEAADSLSVSRQ